VLKKSTTHITMVATAKNTMSVAQHGMPFIFAASSSMNLLFSERIAAFERNGFIKM
jgi:hypothetical protein